MGISTVSCEFTPSAKASFVYTENCSESESELVRVWLQNAIVFLY